MDQLASQFWPKSGSAYWPRFEEIVKNLKREKKERRKDENGSCGCFCWVIANSVTTTQTMNENQAMNCTPHKSCSSEKINPSTEELMATLSIIWPQTSSNLTLKIPELWFYASIIMSLVTDHFVGSRVESSFRSILVILSLAMFQGPGLKHIMLV